MNRSKGFLQKVSTISGATSFVLAIICSVWLYLNFSRLGAYNPITASLEASIFFLVSVGIVLIIIGRCNLPDLKVK